MASHWTDKQCVFEGCTNCLGSSNRSGYCREHRGSWKNLSGRGSLRDSGFTQVGYIAAHRRVLMEKGPAVEQTCPCGKAAAEWAYMYSDPSEQFGPKKAGSDIQVYWSSNPEHYEALCVKCHRGFDRDMRNTLEYRGKALAREISNLGDAFLETLGLGPRS